MDTAQTYDKVYFNDNYKERFEAFREHYRARTRKALQGRKVDHAPVPNANTIVFLHDDPDGGVHITTGDFVEYFNRRFGDHDRIGAARRSLANAVRKAECCPDMEKKRAAAIKKSETKAFTPRSAKPRFAFVHAIFALMLLLAVGMWGGSTIYLQTTESYVLEVEERQAQMVMENTADAKDAIEGDGVDLVDEIAIFMSMGAEDLVDIYPVIDADELPALSIFNKIFNKD